MLNVFQCYNFLLNIDLLVEKKSLILLILRVIFSCDKFVKCISSVINSFSLIQVIFKNSRTFMPKFKQMCHQVFRESTLC